MAGAGSRFAKAGYSLPKPFIDVNGKMMIERVLDGVSLPNAHYTLIIQERFKNENGSELETLSRKYNAAFVSVEGLTQGASCTALAAREIIGNAMPVVFVDSDNIFENKAFAEFVETAQKSGADASLLTVKSDRDCFSYAKVEDGFVTEVREKEVISNHAICGAYYFARGKDFCDTATELLIYGGKTKGEFYMSAVYDRAVKHGLKCTVRDIPLEAWHCTGTPEQLEEYLGSTK